MICPHCGKPVPWKSIDAKKRKEILALSREGYSLRDIALKLNISFASAGRIIRESRKAKGGGAC